MSQFSERAGQRIDYVHGSVNRAGAMSVGSANLSVEQRLGISVTVALSLIMAVILAAILWLCDGHLIYALDDPYISLNLGWHIGHGEYGINAGEAASPSSSILYPFLLAAFAWASWQDWVPLAINAFAAIGTGILLGAALSRYGIVGHPRQITRGMVFIATLCIATNTIGVVFDGLEHSFHLLTSVFVVLALARTLEEDRVRASLVIAIVLLPLWRFEGLALAGLAILGLAVTGHRRPALLAVGGVTATLAAYMLGMHLLGLPLLPSSVLSKSTVAQQTVGAPVGLLTSILHNASASLQREAIPVFLLLALVVAHPVLRLVRPNITAPTSLSLRRELVFASVVAGALTGQVLFGSWGWFCRYEAYAVAFGATGAIVLWQAPIRRLFTRESPVWDGIALAALIYIGQFYVITAIVTPVAAQGIYEQQFQMRRFVVDYYRGPVAVNDLGWVSYRNPHYVLDLWGLGSEEARQARMAGNDPDWVGRLVEARHVGVAMLLDEWFVGQIPPTWHRLAVLRTPKRPTLAFETVSFYATSDDAVAPALEALRAFSQHLIPGTSLTMVESTVSPKR